MSATLKVLQALDAYASNAYDAQTLDADLMAIVTAARAVLGICPECGGESSVCELKAVANAATDGNVLRVRRCEVLGGLDIFFCEGFEIENLQMRRISATTSEVVRFLPFDPYREDHDSEGA